MENRNYQVDYSRYSFKAEDDWGDYDNGEQREGYFKDGYCCHSYLCNDGKWHRIAEHIAKWEYFNGKIPEGLVVDHIIPIKNGGTNKLSNLRIGTQDDNMNNEISIDNMKKAAKERWNNDEYANNMLEIRNTDSYKEKQRLIHLNNTSTSKKVGQYDKITGELIRIWESTMEAERQLGIKNANISACCLKKPHYNSAGGYKWDYV